MAVEADINFRGGVVGSTGPGLALRESSVIIVILVSSSSHLAARCCCRFRKTLLGPSQSGPFVFASFLFFSVSLQHRFSEKHMAWRAHGGFSKTLNTSFGMATGCELGEISGIPSRLPLLRHVRFSLSWGKRRQTGTASRARYYRCRILMVSSTTNLVFRLSLVSL